MPASLREVDPLIPALQNLPLMTMHVGAALLAYATFAVSFGAAVLFLIADGRGSRGCPRRTCSTISRCGR